jgi:hypothetical protein
VLLIIPLLHTRTLNCCGASTSIPIHCRLIDKEEDDDVGCARCSWLLRRKGEWRRRAFVVRVLGSEACRAFKLFKYICACHAHWMNEERTLATERPVRSLLVKNDSIIGVLVAFTNRDLPVM